MCKHGMSCDRILSSNQQHEQLLLGSWNRSFLHLLRRAFDDWSISGLRTILYVGLQPFNWHFFFAHEVFDILVGESPVLGGRQTESIQDARIEPFGYYSGGYLADASDFASGKNISSLHGFSPFDALVVVLYPHTDEKALD